MTLIENLETILAGITPAVLLIVAYVTIGNLIYKKPLKTDKMNLQKTNKNIMDSSNLSGSHVMMLTDHRSTNGDLKCMGNLKYSDGDTTAEKKFEGKTVKEVLENMLKHINEQ